MKKMLSSLYDETLQLIGINVFTNDLGPIIFFDSMEIIQIHSWRRLAI